MKIAVSSYSFSQAMRDGRMNILDVIPKAKELGYDGVEIVRGDQSDREMRALAALLKVQSEEAGIPIIAYMVGADFIKNGLENEVARLKGESEIAALMGAPRMRHDSSAGVDANGNKVSFEDALPIIADGYRQVTEFAAGLGVKTMIENHGFFAQDPDRIEKLINAVGNDNFGALVDIGNFACADVDHAYAVGLTAPYAIHAHAKDFHKKPGTGVNPGEGWFNSRACNYLRGSIIGHGDVPVQQCIAALRRAGYDEYLMIEFEGMEDPLKGIRIGVDNLRRFINA